MKTIRSLTKEQLFWIAKLILILFLLSVSCAKNDDSQDALLQSLEVKPHVSKLFKGFTLQLEAIGTYSDGSTKSLTGDVTWTSDNTQIAAINANGLAQGRSEGLSKIAAKLGTIESGPVNLEIVSEPLIAGFAHTCSTITGKALCWGRNIVGQLGNNSTEDSLVPIEVGPPGITGFAPAKTHTCAVTNGGAWCWGNNQYGQLGNGSTTSSLIPVQVTGLDQGVTAVASGRDHSCAIQRGALKCWGNNLTGMLGDGSAGNTSSVPVQVVGLNGNVTAVAGGNNHTCAIVEGGAQCWGNNISGQLGNNSAGDSYAPVQVFSLTSGVSAIAAGYAHTCAIMLGKVWCWGGNYKGELGFGGTGNSSVPIQVSGLTGDVSAIAVREEHSCAISSGAALCWGNNHDGQLGNNSTTNSRLPVQVVELTSGVTAIGAGDMHSCAVANQQIKCWGANNYGQLGNNSTTPSLIPTLVGP